MNEIVDVIIPTYKRPEMLDKAIESIRNQSYQNISITVVDDNDPESVWRQRTEDAMKKFDQVKNIQYICHDRNKNGSAARNTGFMNTSGEFVCFLDDDDYFLPDKIRLQVEYLLSHKDMSACYCDYIKNGIDIQLPDKTDFSYDILLGLPTPQTSGIMFRREALKQLHGFDDSYYRHQDYELLLRYYDNFQMGKVDKVLYVRERSDIDNIPDGEKLKKLKEKFLAQFSYKIRNFENLEHGYKKKVFVYNYIQVFKSYLKQEEYLNSLKILWSCMKANPVLTINLLLKQYNVHKKFSDNKSAGENKLSKLRK